MGEIYLHINALFNEMDDQHYWTQFLPTGPLNCTYADTEHTQEKENITITPIFPKSNTKTFHEKI